MSDNPELTACQKRAVHPAFVKTFSLEALRGRLPFLFPVPEGLPPSPKRHSAPSTATWDQRTWPSQLSWLLSPSCPAKEVGKEGCHCTAEACAQACRRATALDMEARYIHYEGRNKYADLLPQDKARGRDVYGYASNPDRLLDDRFACAWTIRTGLQPANADERNLFPQSFASLQVRFPYLKTSS